MSGDYAPSTIEPKWQAHWEEHKTFRTANPGEPGFDANRPKFYVLDMFPYPSGSGLHVGHPEGYTATDIIARYKRMKGYNVLHPMGWDAFGLPAEQHAVETGTHPTVTTKKNIDTFRRQLKSLGFSYDWDRELSTTDPEYYRWTQWIFLQLFNSWFDESQQKARPIAELEQMLQSEKLVVRFDGELVSAGPTGMQHIGGIPPGTRFWHELTPEERREIIDDHRLAYLAEVPVNWCPALGTVLANEEVTNEGRSERGNHPVYRRPMRQWMLRITKYADRLEKDLDELAWPESVKIMQRNWIGRSEGAQVRFRLAENSPAAQVGAGTPAMEPTTLDYAHRPPSQRGAGEGDEEIEIFTTRPDTLFGATYMVLAPEHPLVEKITTPQRREAVRAYVAAAVNKSDMDRMAETKKKTGVDTGAFAINPVNQKKIPIWVADYVLMGYGTGAIMAVPGQDQRDWDFAKAFNLPIIRTVQPPPDFDGEAYLEDGPAINSDFLNGLHVADAKKKITGWLEQEGIGVGKINYKLRDWLFSRQRYWGEPFPILHGPDGEIVALDESELPLTLPEMADFAPRALPDDSRAEPEPPLGRAKEWVTVQRHGKTYRRELNTMPQWAGSCWYYLRFLDPRNGERMCNEAAEQYWMVSKKKDGTPHAGGIDLYLGGAEHAVLHLLYARFWHKVLFDLGHVSTPEPFGKLFNQGMIRSFAYTDSRGIYRGYDEIEFRDDGGAYLKSSGEKLTAAVEKMSKALKNVVNPDEVVREYGADSLRLYEMFMGPLDASKPWNPRDVPGVFRFLQRAWRLIAGDDEGRALSTMIVDSADASVEKALHKAIKKVGDDIERMAFNTAISAMMEFVNEAYRAKGLTRIQAQRFVLILAPFAPHLAEELWQRLRGDAWTGSLAAEPWPAYDESMLVEAQVEIPVQVNGKLVGRVTVPRDAGEDIIKQASLSDEKIAARVAGATIVKTIFVPGRLLNLIVKP